MQAATGESARARQAWADYLAMGPGRSLEKLAEEYRTQTVPRTAPTRRLPTLKCWSGMFDWQQRIQDIANEQLATAAAAEAARVRQIMQTGFAQPYERVAVLKELADTLLADLRDPDKRWLRDIKGIGQGENWTEVNVLRFNSAELEQLRALFDDIAKETAGRKQHVDVTTQGEQIKAYIGVDLTKV